MSRFEDCLREATKSIGKNFDEVFDDTLMAEVREVLDGVEETLKIYETKMLQENSDISTNASELLAGTSNNLEFLMRKKLQDSALAAMKEEKIFLEVMDKSNTPDGIVRALKDLIEGNGASAIHKKTSAEQGFKTSVRSIISEGEDGAFTEKVFKRLGSHLWNSKKNRDFYNRAMRAFHRLSNAEANEVAAKLDDLIPNVKERKAIEDIYGAIRKTNDDIYAKKVNSGILLGNEKGYLWRRSYSTEKIRAIEPKDFAEKMEELVDHNGFIGIYKENSAAGKKARLEMFERMYDNFDTLKGTVSEDSEAFTAFLASRTKSRKLRYKTGDAEFEAFELFGNETDLLSILSREHSDAATAITNYSMFGSAPKETYSKAVKRIHDATKKGFNAEGRQKYADTLTKQETRGLQILTVMEQRPDTNYSALGKVFIGLKYAQLFKLGSTTIATAPFDILTGMHTAMVDRGSVNAFKALHEQVSKFSKIATMDRKTREKLAAKLSLFSNVVDSTSVSRLHNDIVASDGGTVILEKMSQGAGKFLDSTGLSKQTHWSEMTNGVAATATLKQSLRKAKNGTLSPAMKETLEQARFDKSEMAILTENLDKLKGLEEIGDPDDFIDPLKIYELDDSLFSGNKNAALARKDELHSKIVAFINGRAKQGTPQPTLATSFNLGKNTLTDTDAIVNSMFTFKGTIMKMGTDYAERFARAQRTMGAPAHSMQLAQYVGMSIGVYFAIDTISSALLDKAPSYKRLEQGDFAGVFTNFINKTSPAPLMTDPIMRLIESQNRFGQSALTDVATGPVGSMARDLENIWKSKDSGKAALRFLRSHGPGSGHFLLRGGGRHMFGYDMLTGKETSGKDEFIEGSLFK